MKTLSLYRRINDKGGLATSLNGLGMVECALGNYQAACPYFQQALQITTEMQFIPRALSILIGISDLLLQTGQTESGLELMTLARHHPLETKKPKIERKSTWTISRLKCHLIFLKLLRSPDKPPIWKKLFPPF